MIWYNIIKKNLLEMIIIGMINSRFRYEAYLLIIVFLFPIILISFDPNKNQIAQETRQINISAERNRYEVTVGHPYNWIDASSEPELPLGDDDSALTTLPFNFIFYDGNFTKIYVVTEGYLTFSLKSVLTSLSIPSSHPHRQNIIAPYLTDLDGNSGQIYIKNFSSYWVAAWENFNLDNGSFTGSFEVVLYNNGDIVFNYDILENVSTYACGLNYGDNVNYSSYNELTSGINDFSIKFSLINGENGNGIVDGNHIGIIVGVSVTLGIIGIVGGIILYFYKKNPEQFKAKFKRGKEKIKEKIPKNE